MNEQIKQLVLSKSGTAQEIAEQLNAKTEEVTKPALLTSAGLVLELGVELATEALARLEMAMNSNHPLAPLLRAQYNRLNSTGIDFGHPVTKQIITQLTEAGVFTEGIKNALLNLDKEYKSRYELIAGDNATISAEEVEAIQAKASQAEQLSRVVVNAVFDVGQNRMRGSIIKEYSAGDIVVSREVLSHTEATGVFQALESELKKL